MIKDIIDNLGSDVLTEEAKTSISEAFNEAVQAKLDETFDIKVAEKALELVEAKDVEYKQYMSEVEAKYVLEAQEYKTALLESIDTYLSELTKELVAKNINEMKNDISVVKADAILAAFAKLGLNVSISDGSEASATAIAESEKQVQEHKTEIDRLITENKSTSAELLALKKSVICEKACVSMTEIQKTKFSSLVEAIGEISDIEEFGKKVSIIAESISELKDEKQEISESKTVESNKNRFL